MQRNVSYSNEFYSSLSELAGDEVPSGDLCHGAPWAASYGFIVLLD